jgi:hypothetical protein
MSHMDLMSYYKVVFSLTQFHKWSITEIENLMPWERDIFVSMLIKHIEEEENKQPKSE